jgi:hypothetical protein
MSDEIEDDGCDAWRNALVVSQHKLAAAREQIEKRDDALRTVRATLAPKGASPHWLVQWKELIAVVDEAMKTPALPTTTLTCAHTLRDHEGYFRCMLPEGHGSEHEAPAPVKKWSNSIHPGVCRALFPIGPNIRGMYICELPKGHDGDHARLPK